jgi:hypothetical protein
MRRAAGGFAVLAVAAGLSLAPATAASAVSPTGDSYAFCPGPRPVVEPSAVWTRRSLASGVALDTAHTRFGSQPLTVSVLGVSLANPNVRTVALHGGLSNRHPLTSLAASQHLVAATNGMYFNFGTGTPTVPFVEGAKPIVLSTTPKPVAGISVDGQAQSGNVWLKAAVRRADGLSSPLDAVNTVHLPVGVSLYTASWGTGRIPLPDGARTRTVEHGVVTTGMRRTKHVPAHSYVLVARGALPKMFLESLTKGSHVSVPRHVKTDAPARFSQAYGTGTQVVRQAGVVEDDLYCNKHEIYAARTTIAWDATGKDLMLVSVESAKGSENHGVDENQMSNLLVSLGATQAFALDGGGSTEMLARLPTVHRVKTKTRARTKSGKKKVTVHVKERTTWDLHKVVHARTERSIPVGIGIYSRSTHKATHWRAIK